MSRRPLVAGNWKMHTDASSARDLARSLARALASTDASASQAVSVAFFPPFPFLEAVVAEVAASGATSVAVGAQDLHAADSGAFTGGVSGPQIASTGASWVLVGHSERRSVFGDNDVAVLKKLLAARRAGLRPILCVGETLAERESGQGERVVERQIRFALEGGEGLDGWTKATKNAELCIAYEPVWAIGTGKTASPEMAEAMQAHIRGLLPQRSWLILYGGSVKANNALDLMKQENIDGLLVGGASLEAEGFLSIIRAAAASAKS